MDAGSWSVRTEELSNGRGRRLCLMDGEMVAPWARVCRGWHEDSALRLLLRDSIAELPFEAALWETPPVTRSSFDRAFECVLLESPTLARMAVDPGPFQGWIQREQPVVAFPNLGGDALLVAPCARDRDECYAHLAAFARKGPLDQWHALWSAVARAIESRVGARSLWVSTSGLGVAWLHIRLDDRPKYVTHEPYWEAPREHPGRRS